MKNIFRIFKAGFTAILISSLFPIFLFAQNYLPGQVVVDPDHPEWLKYNEGGPFFMCGPGDPEGFLYRGSRNPDGTRSGDQMLLINKMIGTGANCIYLMAVRSNGGDGGSDENPYINSDPNNDLDSDILEQWETWFTEMDNNGIVIFFIFYDDGASIWSGNDVGPEEQHFIQTLVDSFEHHKHLIWCVAEEYSEAYSSTRVSNIAAAIRAADDHNHAIAVHQLNGLTFDFANDPNIDQFAIQYNEGSASALHSGMVTAWNNSSGRYNLNMSEAASHGSGSTMRLKNWACAMGGAYVMVLGMDISGTTFGDLESCGRLREFFEQTNFNEMAPHDELKFGETKYVLASSDTSYILYSDNSGDIGVQGMDAGNYNLLWFDPVDGDQELAADVTISAGNQLFTRPASIGNEVALYITRVSSPNSIDDNAPSGTPEGFRLDQNYPNPFNPVTNIRFSLMRKAQVSLTVYNILGEEISTLFSNKTLAGGEHEMRFDGSELETGVYLYRLSANSTSETRKMVLLK